MEYKYQLILLGSEVPQKNLLLAKLFERVRDLGLPNTILKIITACLTPGITFTIQHAPVRITATLQYNPMQEVFQIAIFTEVILHQPRLVL